jgi:Ca2+-transporting ATPase
MKPWHAMSIEEAFSALQSSPEGLSSKEAAVRIAHYGKNEITTEQKISPLKIFLSQFTDFLVLILIGAALVSFFMSFMPGQEDQIMDAILITLILVANAIFGFIQEYKAEKGVQELKKMVRTRARVLRDSVWQEVDASELVPGDVVEVEQGSKVPADCLIIEAFNAAADESMLSGESLPVSKEACTLPEEMVLTERKNMLFMNTVLVRGKVKALVVGTGMNTEVGKIASHLQQIEETKSPFQLEIEKLGKKIGYAIFIIIGVVATIELLIKQGALYPTFMRAVSLAVAAVPEGLPIVVTLALAVGVAKMKTKKALARRLSVVESLGSVNVICTDKTGTLTENKMHAVKIFVNGKIIELKNLKKHTSEPAQKVAVERLIECASLCNDAYYGKTSRGMEYIGDPTEVALLDPAAALDVDVEKLRSKHARIDEIPFSSERKMMSTLNAYDGKTIVMVKGAPEVILERSESILINGKIVPLSRELRSKVEEANNLFASSALRVLALAFKERPGDKSEWEKNLTFIGLIGMIDPPREGVKKAIEDCRNAGIRVVMLTGDNLETAKAIGKQLGFSTKHACTGKELEKMSEEELLAVIEKAEIFARVSPTHKLRILKAFQKKGKIVAMTGDGVNDAPALKNADVGIAMGIRGTDVARQTSDLILLDDNFVTIRDAIEEGRGIFDNIRKFVNYLLSANFGEVGAVFMFTLVGMLLPIDKHAVLFTAAQLLWINLLTDGLPALALGVDPKDPNIMKRTPRKKGEAVINKRMMFSIVSVGITIAALVLYVYLDSFFSFKDAVRAQTVAFTSIIVFEFIRVHVVRVNYGTRILSNKWLWLAIFVSLGLQMIALYTPLNKAFGIIPLNLQDWMLLAEAFVIFLIASVVIVLAERKLFGVSK